MLNLILFGFFNFLNRKKPLRVTKIDTLAAFVKDFIHELFAVLTALQANVDLLQEDKTSSDSSEKRFAAANRAISRLVRDTRELSDVLKISTLTSKREKVRLDLLMKEIKEETQSEFSLKDTELCSEIAFGTTLLGNSDSIKKMITSIVLNVLGMAKGFSTIKVVGLSTENSTEVLIFDGLDSGDGEFIPWKLGQLKLTPINGDLITLSAVDAIAKFNLGYLSIRSSEVQPKAYRLSFEI